MNASAAIEAVYSEVASDFDRANEQALMAGDTP